MLFGYYRGYKNIYGQKYWEYMGRQITEILEKLRKTTKTKEKLEKPRKTKKNLAKPKKLGKSTKKLAKKTVKNNLNT